MDEQSAPIAVFDLYGQKVVVTGWKIFGFLGTLIFCGRWLVQVYCSKRAGKSVTPKVFWLMSILGSAILLTYFIFSPKQDAVGVLSNAFPCVISVYNLYLDRKKTTPAPTVAEKSAETPVGGNTQVAPLS